MIPQVPLVEAMSKVQISVSTSQENAIKEIDKILKNRKPEEVVAMLKNEIKNGRDKITPTVVKDSILATGLMKVYHHGFDS